jgi:hypothetical protein
MYGLIWYGGEITIPVVVLELLELLLPLVLVRAVEVVPVVPEKPICPPAVDPDAPLKSGAPKPPGLLLLFCALVSTPW